MSYNVLDCIVASLAATALECVVDVHIGRDIIAGVFYIVGEDGHGNLTSLPEPLMQAYMTRFWEPEQYTAADIEHALFMRFF